MSVLGDAGNQEHAMFEPGGVAGLKILEIVGALLQARRALSFAGALAVGLRTLTK